MIEREDLWRDLKRLAHLEDDGTACLLLEVLRRRFFEPEDWRALFKYVARVRKQHFHRSTTCVAPIMSVGPPYRVHAVADLLTSQGYPVTADRLYDWIKNGKVRAVKDDVSRLCLDRAGAKEAGSLAASKLVRKGLIERLQEQGKSHAAAKKYLQRHPELIRSLADRVSTPPGPYRHSGHTRKDARPVYPQ
jgi:hypothetical protein